MADDYRDITVIIPALNEEASIPLVLADLPPVGRVIVVDNGSSDGTAGAATKMGATVVREPRRGYGSACLKGMATIEHLIAMGEPPPAIVVFVDADYSDHADLLPVLVSPIRRGKCKMTLGSRILGQRERGAMPPQAVYGNKLACFLMARLFGIHCTDLGPFRAIDYQALQRIGMTDRDFGWTIEMQIKAALAGVKMLEIPVPYRRRVGASKISGTIRGTIRAGSKILYTIAKYAWWARFHRDRDSKSRKRPNTT